MKNYFANKNMLTSDSIPTQGKFKIGDIVVNTGNDAKENPFWICTESGSPGSWQSINVKSESKLYAFKNKVIISEAKTNIDMGIGVISNRDILLVFINDKLAYENIDYIIEGNIIKTTNDNVWNDILSNDFTFEFIAFKAILNIDETFELTNENAPNEIVTFNKLSKDIKDRIDTATADLSIYQDISDNNLSTNSKTVVGAINELVQNIDTGKGLIANATGKNTVTKDSSYEELSDAIVELKQDVIKKQEFEQYKNKVNQYTDDLSEIMIDNGCEITGQETLSELIDIIALNGLKIREIEQVICTGYTTCILKKDGTVLICGKSHAGIISGSGGGGYSSFTVTTLTDIKQISCSENHTAIVKKDGTLWMTGYNAYGQCGTGNTTSVDSPKKITAVGSNIIDAHCGDSFTHVLTADGNVYACGENDNGQVGVSDFANKLSFVHVASNVKQLACGSNYAIILKNDGTIYGCGDNSYGQLGLSAQNDHGSYTKVEGLTGVKQIACGSNHTIILKDDGTVWATGNNNNGQLGINTFGNNTNKWGFVQVLDGVEKICGCGGYSVIVQKTDGTFWGSGSNGYGQLGLGNSSQVVVFTQLPNLSKIKQISCGIYHTFAMQRDGTLLHSGYNSNGQLGLGSLGGSITSFTKINL